MGRCMLCGKETDELQTIESIFTYDADAVEALLGSPVEGTKGSDVLTVCVELCANVVRSESDIIIRDERFTND